MVNLKVNFCGVEFLNPTVLAACPLGVTSESLKKVVEAGAGGVTTKTMWLNEHIGHPDPVTVQRDEHFLNAVGIPSEGIVKACDEWSAYADQRKVPLIASVIAKSEHDFDKVVEGVSAVNPDFIEINISCPNIEDEFGKPLAFSATKVAEVTANVKKYAGAPVIIKMSPNVTNWVEIAQAAESAGADALCCFNTFGPGMAIDINTRQPILSNKVGGVSGPGLRPLVVKMINDIYRAVKIPIIGAGGVMKGEDAIELMMAGASLVGMATMTYYRGIEGFGLVVNEIKDWCEQSGIQDVNELIGVVEI